MLDLLRPNHAYLLGFLLGDGTLYAGRGRKGRLSVEVSARDGALLERLGALLPGASLSTRERPTNFSPLSSTVVLSWCRYDVREAVRAAGMPVGRKDRVVAPPDAPFSTRDLARGFVDADGSVGFTARSVPFVSVVSNSLAMARWWTAVVQERSGVTRTATPNRRDGAINVMVQSDAAARLCAWLHQSGDLALERKRSTALQVAGWTRRPASGAEHAAALDTAAGRARARRGAGGAASRRARAHGGVRRHAPLAPGSAAAVCVGRRRRADAGVRRPAVAVTTSSAGASRERRGSTCSCRGRPRS